MRTVLYSAESFKLQISPLKRTLPLSKRNETALNSNRGLNGCENIPWHCPFNQAVITCSIKLLSQQLKTNYSRRGGGAGDKSCRKCSLKFLIKCVTSSLLSSTWYSESTGSYTKKIQQKTILYDASQHTCSTGESVEWKLVKMVENLLIITNDGGISIQAQLVHQA